MSYLKKIEYEIVPEESFVVIRNCSGCGRKTHFINTKKFRVNANGSKLDVWLIYQCEKCKHTFNLAIYERRKASSIPKNEYQCFLSNDEQLAEMYGKNMQLFKRNKAEIDFERLKYDFVKLHETTESNEFGEMSVLAIHNPCELKIRPEKQIAEVLGLSRSQAAKRMGQGEIKLETASPQFLSVCVKGCLLDMMQHETRKDDIKS
ncbi:MAG: DUF1062 domain-containing protein [Lachnospiraceae bacterium]|nr:DUF1062 domain-containing protein [Lachnospiraceae bacterium]